MHRRNWREPQPQRKAQIRAARRQPLYWTCSNGDIESAALGIWVCGPTSVADAGCALEASATAANKPIVRTSFLIMMILLVEAVCDMPLPGQS